ncbi:MAG: indole-3-glycerol phosphate synthase TrpC [Spirochaetaceae bacterium]|jgi:indole-3-glycerol phosphate synthase|nr:indole-3-glycerol phosphate synthase TrpC [Spirochaetaceae bacterium]
MGKEDILEKIAGRTRKRVSLAKEKRPFSVLRAEAEAVSRKVPDFSAALSRPGLSFICEVKKASPSKGLIAEDFPYLRIAQEYESAGAEAVSVLTEPDFFLGSDEYLREIAETVRIPALRKDFVIDEYQIYEAKVLGASAVLFICALIIDEKRLVSYLECAGELGLSALVEAHTEAEIETALRAEARIIGVNNRNLRTFAVDPAEGLKLRSLVPRDRLFVSESGIRSRSDVQALEEYGADAALIGEALMRAPDKTAFLAELRGLR